MFDWLSDLHKTQPIAHATGVRAFVCVMGKALEILQFRGIGVAGHFGDPVDEHTLHFGKEFGAS